MSDVLEDKLSDYTIFKIKEFEKEELFQRFVLDVISGAYILYDRNKVGRNSYVKNFFREFMIDRIVSRDMLQNRIAEVRERKYKPDFSYML